MFQHFSPLVFPCGVISFSLSPYCHLLSPFPDLTQYHCNHIWQIDPDPLASCTQDLIRNLSIIYIIHSFSSFLPSLLLFWTQLDHWTCCHAGEFSRIRLCLSEGGHAARRHTYRHDLHYRWAARSNLFVLRWLQFLCHRTLGLQINIPGLSGSQVCFETGDRHTGIMADAWGEFFKTCGASSLWTLVLPAHLFFFLLAFPPHGFICHL